MAVVALTTTKINKESVNLATAINTAANADGNTFINNGKTVFGVRNGSASPITVTIEKDQDAIYVPGFGSVDVADRVITVAAGATWMDNPAQKGYVDPQTGRTLVTFSAVTDVKVAALEFVRD